MIRHTRCFQFCLSAARLGLCGLLAAGLLGLALVQPAKAQDCVPANFFLSTQAQVNAFPQGCMAVTGYLVIGPSADITALSPLSALTSVGELLYIRENAALPNLDGLSALTSVEGDLNIVINAALTNVDGLSALTYVEGDLYIGSNAALTNVDGLSALTYVGGELVHSGQ